MIKETSLNQSCGKKHRMYNGAFLKSLSICMQNLQKSIIGLKMNTLCGKERGVCNSSDVVKHKFPLYLFSCNWYGVYFNFSMQIFIG